MKTNIVIWWMLSGFFLLCFAAYVVWNFVDYGKMEWIGSVALLFTAFMTALIGYFVTALHRGQKGVELPEDRLDVGIDDADPEVGEFAPWSWWPIVLAAAPAVGVLSLATAHFLIPLAAALLIIGIVGWVFEYYRGNFAR